MPHRRSGEAVALGDPRRLDDHLAVVVVRLTDDLNERPSAGDDGSVLGFEVLTAPVAAIAAEASRLGPVVYVHQELHGDTGFDAAVCGAGR